MSEIEYTNRGFGVIKFRDEYGAYCSLQESSAARLEEDDGTTSDGFIWLGIDKERDGFVPGKEIKSINGMVKLGARMHLSQSTVRELLPLLEYFAEHGELPTPDDD